MKLLLHMCCAPCTTYPLRYLRKKNIEITGYFYNPNIHPYREYKKRLETLKSFAQSADFPLHIAPDYELNEFLRGAVSQEQQRCGFCYSMRLQQTAYFASENGFEGFSTTLLYSRYQNHSLIKKQCESLAAQYNLTFFYEDFRKGWQEGIDISIGEDMYRQPYCGCIYSERERYDNRLKKQLKKQRKREQFVQI